MSALIDPPEQIVRAAGFIKLSNNIKNMQVTGSLVTDNLGTAVPVNGSANYTGNTTKPSISYHSEELWFKA